MPEFVNEDTIICPHCRKVQKEQNAGMFYEREVACDGCMQPFSFVMTLTYDIYKK